MLRSFHMTLPSSFTTVTCFLDDFGGLPADVCEAYDLVSAIGEYLGRVDFHTGPPLHNMFLTLGKVWTVIVF